MNVNFDDLLNQINDYTKTAEEQLQELFKTEEPEKQAQADEKTVEKQAHASESEQVSDEDLQKKAELERVQQLVEEGQVLATI
jgi:hypothetical protein